LSAPLEGIRVVSLAEQYPGPYCTLLLADMGADVVLAERPGSGDPSRGPNGMSDFFASLNRNKRSITVNLKSEEGCEVCRRLMKWADVFVEGFRPGTMDRLGLGYEVAGKINPRLIYCSISGFGQSGPYRDRPAHDLSFQSMAGLLANLIKKGNFADRPGVAIGDLSSGMFAVIGILAALEARHRTGRGQYVDVSMMDGLVSWMGTAIDSQLKTGHTMEMGGAAFGVYKTKDSRYVSLSVALEPHFWRNLWQAVGRPELGQLSFIERWQRNDELEGILREVFLTKTRDEWVEVLASGDVPSGPVLTLDEVATDPQVQAREMVVDWRSPDGKTEKLVNHPIRFSETPAGLRLPAPRLGEHADEVLSEIGYKKEEIERLHDAGAV
jgi:crotonobetainyl-CoA:carnitine CoA-transferase CaiB-like acyl-CoA transferase